MIAALTPKVLTTLIAIAETGSFARAAEREHMTLSALSMQMKALEAALDAQLFDRRTRPPRLTPLGRSVSAIAQAMLEKGAEAVRLCQAPGPIRGIFDIGFVLTASVRLLPRFLAEAGPAFPNATFQVRTGLSQDLAQEVARGALDAAIVTAGEHEAFVPGVRATTLTREALMFCSPGNQPDRPIAQWLEDVPFVHFTPDSGIGGLIAQFLQAQPTEPREVIILDTVEAVAECVRAGVGSAILPEPDVRRYGGDAIRLMPISPTPVSPANAPQLTRRLVLLTRDGDALDQAREAIAAVLAPDRDIRSANT